MNVNFTAPSQARTVPSRGAVSQSDVVMSDNSEQLSLLLSAIGLGSVATHFALVPWAPILSVVLAPVHAACCGFLLLLLHPAVGTVLDRARLLGKSNHGDPLMLMADPVIAAAMSLPPPPPPWRYTLFALAFRALADLLAGLHLAQQGRGFAGSPLTPGIVLLEFAHETAAAVSSALLLYASWRLGAPPSTFLTFMCWGVSMCAGLQMLLAVPPPEGLGTMALVAAGTAAARTLLSCALLAQAACALCGALLEQWSASDARPTALPPATRDVLRWGAQAAGSALGAHVRMPRCGSIGPASAPILDWMVIKFINA